MDDSELMGQADAAAEFLRERADMNGFVSGCTSYVQRRLQCGYNRAACILDELVRRGVVTEPSEHGARRVLSPSPN